MCKAATFLTLGGGIVCATTLLKLVAILTPCEWDDKVMNILSPIADFVHFCIIMWGSVVVFGKLFKTHLTYRFTVLLKNVCNFDLTIFFTVSKYLDSFNDNFFPGQYGQWVYKRPEIDNAELDPNFCEYTPFMFAFVVLILQWILLPFLLCCSIMLCCCAFCYKAVDDGDQA